MKKHSMGSIFLAGGLAVLAFPARASIITTCAQYQTVTTASTPAYDVQTNYWNKGSCPTTQCLWIDNVTGDFAVTAGDFTCSNTVATYPSIYYGCHFGNCSPGTNLPMAVSLLQCVTSSWTVSTTDTGYWNAAYDIWFSTTTNTTSYSGGAELMIWMDYMPGTGPGGSLKASGVTIDGATWNVNEGPVGWNYIAYLANNPVTQFDNMDILAFINDSVSRGYIQPSWYLAAIEAGNELRTGGVPFGSSGFSANVNGGNCGTSTPTPTNTPTATSTPCGWPGATCTPTFTPTPTPTLSNNYVTYPNP
ncbi:MAG TPA: hypothetical protein VMV05_04260, partial [bacterium]|nr:hypothetical protein [bacterium]